ncbi:cytochrome P450 4V2-like [Brevipalpus obovatus]|uniref:cytochrome P450 4V2-like n=1 Tax=Brevipalpus obovatus TaxID=246614 RepID=UPI003D9F60E0
MSNRTFENISFTPNFENGIDLESMQVTRAQMVPSFLISVFKVILIIVLVTFAIKFGYYATFLRKLRKLPQKPSHWIFGHVRGLKPPPFSTGPAFGRGLKRILDKSADFLHQNGLMVFWFSWIPTVIVTEPAIIEKLLNSKIEKGPGFDIARKFFGDGLVMQRLEKWRGRRKLMTSGLHGAVLSRYIPIMNTVIHDWIGKIHDQLEKNPTDVMRLCQKIGMDMICATTMGIERFEDDSPEAKYRSAIEVAVEMILMRVINPLYWFDMIFSWTSDGKRSKRAQEYIKKFSTNLISLKTATASELNSEATLSLHNRSQKVALLDHLVELHINSVNGSSKVVFSADGVNEEVNTTLFAGNESTASTMAWTLFLLGAHPQIQDDVHKEIINNLGTRSSGDTTNDFYNEDSLRKLNYLDCCVKESMRICPSIHTITRHLSEDLVVDSHTIPAGTIASICIYYLHWNPKFYPEPEKFIPERFSPNSSIRPSFSFIPFGGGQRQCVGQTLAMRLIKIVVAEIVRNFQIQSCCNLDRIDKTFLGTLKPSEPIKIILKKRDSE